ncbi:RICIN domain-containing protein [Streptomyces sp. NBC_01102]|uniref:RICIN domain-containing protein n=1 Tax=Streptomyces sp. NBC_01102 TaxID=2903749 RepID=UPI003866B1A5|nr:RICIN domain-containing protein [Streptomyces sp. NBC_01102]
MPQTDSTDPAGIPAGGETGPGPIPLPVRKPSTDPAKTSGETRTPDEAQRANVARALRATRRAASGTSGTPVPAARPSGAGSTPPPHGRPPEESATSPSRLPRTRVLVGAIAGALLLLGALLLPGLGDDPRTPTASHLAGENPRAGSTRSEAAPSDEGAKNSAESAEEKRKAGNTGEVPPDGAEKDQGKGKNTSGAHAPEDVGEAVSDSSGVASGAGAKTSGDEAAPDRKDGTVTGQTLTGRQSGKCLSGGGAGAQLTIRTCDGSADQRWEFRSDGTVRSQGLCMDLVGASKDNGTAVRVASCTGAAAQQFDLNATDDLVARFAAKCVDVYDSRSADGTRAVLWPCTGAANQTWTLP